MSVLEEIVAAKKVDLERRMAACTLAEVRRVATVQSAARDFTAALQAPGLSVIAEIKRRSPARGDLNVTLDAGAQAQRYFQAGASAISVLTDEQYFRGRDEDLVAARAASPLPVLRKDFTIHPYQVFEARAIGADAVLLIVRALADDLLVELRLLAEGLGMAALVEVHDEDELVRAVKAGASIIGINNRNLDTLTVDPATSFRLRPSLPDGIVAVSESGIGSPDLAARLHAVHFDAILVGEALVTSPEPAALLAALRGEEPARSGQS